MLIRKFHHDLKLLVVINKLLERSGEMFDHSLGELVETHCPVETPSCVQVFSVRLIDCGSS